MRDTLATLGALVYEAVTLTGERLRPHRRGAGTPRHPASISPAWLTGALQPAFGGVRVRALEPLDAHAGTTDRVRLAVHYEAGGPRQPPPSVFVKMPPRDLPTRLFVNLMGLGSTEVRFYTELSASAPIDTPRLFYASAGRAGGFVLVLEDLEARGVQWSDALHPLDVDRARLVVQALARLHAALRDRAEAAWLCRGLGSARYPVERFVSARGIAAAVRRFPDLMPPAARAAAPRLAAARDALEAAWLRPPLTVIHGDAHAGNLYFSSDAVGFFDWQVAQRGQGLRDVAYFAITSLHPALRRAHERDLLTLYLATLAAHGGEAPAPPAAWLQYRLHAAYTWIATAVTAAAARLQAGAIARAGLVRASTAFADLDPLGALADLGKPVVRSRA